VRAFAKLAPLRAPLPITKLTIAARFNNRTNCVYCAPLRLFDGPRFLDERRWMRERTGNNNRRRKVRLCRMINTAKAEHSERDHCFNECIVRDERRNAAKSNNNLAQMVLRKFLFEKSWRGRTGEGEGSLRWTQSSKCRTRRKFDRRLRVCAQKGMALTI